MNNLKLLLILGETIFFRVTFWKYKTPGGAAGDETLVLWKPDFHKNTKNLFLLDVHICLLTFHGFQ